LVVLAGLAVAIALWRDRMIAANEHTSVIPPKEPRR